MGMVTVTVAREREGVHSHTQDSEGGREERGRGEATRLLTTTNTLYFVPGC